MSQEKGGRAGTRLTKNVNRETDESMVSRHDLQRPVKEDDVPKVVDEALAVEEVHGRAQKVPVQSLGEAQVAGLARNIGNGDDFLERDNLYSSDDEDDVYVAHEQRKEEAANHDERPQRTRNEVCLFLFVV